MNDNIMVSICCIAYNHENYIEDTLNGFLMQKTNFKYEIVIHDDASTDSTAKIIRNFENKYPYLVRVIYQKDNKYSQKIPIIETFVLPQTRGKYIALCEGDDYWIDENKLQIQVNYIESNPTCTLCCHAHQSVDVNNKILETKRIYNFDTDIPVENCLKLDKFPQFGTYVYRKDIINDRPDFFKVTPVGDLTLLAYCAIKGNVHYIDKVMSSYRVGTPGSWSSRISKNVEMRKDHRDRMNIFYEKFNAYTNSQFEDIFQYRISSYKFSSYLEDKKYLLAFKEDYFKNSTIIKKIILFINVFYPSNVPIFKKFKLSIKQVINKIREIV